MSKPVKERRASATKRQIPIAPRFRAPKWELPSAFTLGAEAAEVDQLLGRAFYESSTYIFMSSREDRRCFVVGRTGSGKSAALSRLEAMNPEHVIRISPENLAIPYLTNLQVFTFLEKMNVKLDNFWNVLWKHALIVEIIRHRYRVDSLEAKNNFMRSLRDILQKDKTKQAALAYLDEFEGRFWCEADERVRELTERLTERLKTEAGAKADVLGNGLNLGEANDSEYINESRMELVERFQRVVNENQLARLNKMMDVLDDHILGSRQDFRYIIIDNLDEDWVDDRVANDLIRCLFTTVYGLQQRVQNLKVIVALRTNILQELDFGRRGGQEEKFRGLQLEIRWTRHDLKGLLNERVSVAAQEAGFEATSISELLPSPHTVRGDPLDYLLDRTLLRPRDAISFLNSCLSISAGQERVSWEGIEEAERYYSENRLIALRQEWNPTYPGIERVLAVFRRSPSPMSRKQFMDRLDSIMLLLAEHDFIGAQWLNEASRSMWNSNINATFSDIYQPLAKILYDIGLIGASVSPSRRPVFQVDYPEYFKVASNLEGLQFFYIHPTYHQGLEVRDGYDRV